LIAPLDIRINFPDDVRSRKVVTRSRARPTGKYPSWKAGRMLQWESAHELNAFRILDADPEVRTFREQPCVIRYPLAGESRIHYPDVLVESGSCLELWEIKPAVDAAKTDVAERTRVLAEGLPGLGYGYRLQTAEDLAREPRLSNALALLKFGRAPAPALTRERLRRMAEMSGGIPWGAVVSGSLGPGMRATACRLALEGVLSFNRERPLVDDSRLIWAVSHASTGTEG
jgi:hypothetical protein